VFLHAITGPAALRALLPHVPAELRVTAFAYAWQAVAASAATFGSVPLSEARPADADQLGSVAAEEVKSRALDTGDEHAIKLLDACLRETELNPTPVYLRATGDWANRLLGAAHWKRGQRIAAGLAAV
jgi:hypothetical protein